MKAKINSKKLLENGFEKVGNDYYNVGHYWIMEDEMNEIELIPMICADLETQEFFSDKPELDLYDVINETGYSSKWVNIVKDEI